MKGVGHSFFTVFHLMRFVYEPSEFMARYPEYIREEDNALKFISNDGGRSYNRCHCGFQSLILLCAMCDRCVLVWSNFEIASLDFWRSAAYTAFFEHLDASGGFYYEVRRRSLIKDP